MFTTSRVARKVDKFSQSIHITSGNLWWHEKFIWNHMNFSRKSNGESVAYLARPNSKIKAFWFKMIKHRLYLSKKVPHTNKCNTIEKYIIYIQEQKN